MDLKKLIKEVLESRNPDCGCGCGDKCGKAPILNENLQSRILMTENMKYHIDNKKPLIENTFRYGSKAFLDLWAEARFLYSRDAISLSGMDKEIILETNLGEYGLFEGQMVPLDMPILEEGTFENNEIAIYDDPNGDTGETKIYKRGTGYYGVNDLFDFEAKDKAELETKLKRWGYKLQAGGLNEAEYQGKKVSIGKPKRGGASGKKFYVYVMNKGKVKKVSFGDSGGLSTKVNDPKARQAFAKRHKCAQKTDRTKASYWSCRIGRYWKSLGGSKNFSGYW
jgi:hypothetical protein